MPKQRSNPFSGPTVLEIMDLNRGTGPGFDLWRVGLSLMVILVHSFHVSYGSAPYLANGIMGPLFGWILPIFFALSGFLVTGSAIRTNSVKVFLAFRGLRIIPALLTEVTLAALFLGPIVTTLPLAEYFTDPKFFVYFGNVVGWVHFYLPGVFENNARAGIVNQNLWTLHPELASYALMAGLIVSKIIYDRKLITIFFIVTTVIMSYLNIVYDKFELNGNYPSPVLVYSFLFGAFLFHWRAYVVLNIWLFLASLVLSYVLLLFKHTTFIVHPFLAYVMVYVGMLKFPRMNFLQKGDYSYGMYLYGYPIQQTLWLFLPWSREWYYNFTMAVIISLAIAMLSWHFVEKPALKLKRFVGNKQAKIPSTTEP